ncbi:MAG: cytochrome c3 family protein [Deltaproteobacteria bacterium]|nr:cytochrome c3 family protein [Deltaproteobacteria bacterium]
MQENRYSVSLCFTLLSICPFLFIGIVFGVLSGCSEKSEQTKASHESVSEKRVIAELPKIGEIVTTETLSDGEEKRSDIRLKQVGSSIQEGIAFPNIIDMNNKAYAKHAKGIQTFTHMKHAKEYAEKHPELYKNGCGSCHHDKNNKPLRNLKEGDDVQNCIECHKKAGYIKGKEAKGLSKEKKREYHANAIHDNCKGCHKDFNKKMMLKSKDKGAAPVTCKTCHGDESK